MAQDKRFGITPGSISEIPVLYRLLKTRINLVVIIAALIIFSIPAFSVENNISSLQESSNIEDKKTELPGNPSLADYISYAVQNSPVLKSAYESWQAKIEKSRQAGTMPEPVLSYMLPLQEMTSEPVYERQKISITQMFPWFGKLSLQEQASLFDADAEKNAYDMAERELIFRVVKAYYEYYYLGRTIESTARNLHLLIYLEEVTRTRYSAAQAEYNDLLKLQVEIEKLKNEMINLNDQIPVYSARLSAEIGLKPGDAFLLPEKIDNRDVIISLEAVDGLLVNTNPSIKMLDAMIEASKAMEALAGREFFPDVMIGFEYRDMESRVEPNLNENMDSIMFMFSVSLPIKFGKYSSMAAEAGFTRTSLEKQRADLINQLTVSFRQALFMFKEAGRRAVLYEENLIPKGRESVNASMEAFIGGRSALMEFIDSERMLLEFEVQMERAKADREIAAAEMEMLAGKKIFVDARNPAIPEKTK